MPYVNSFSNAITYEMSLNNKVYARRVYSSLDFVSDLGGLFGALRPLSILFITVINYYSMY